MTRTQSLVVIFVSLVAFALAGGASARAELTIQQIAPGVYYGEAPTCEQDYQQLQSLGIATVLELRKFMPRKIARGRGWATAYGMNYYHVPLGFRPSRDDSVERALQILANPSLHPIYMHCNLGRDRTGLIVALYRTRYMGWSRSAAYAEMRGDRFNPLLRDMGRYYWRRAR